MASLLIAFLNHLDSSRDYRLGNKANLNTVNQNNAVSITEADMLGLEESIAVSLDL